jgi:hypothetical protein
LAEAPSLQVASDVDLAVRVAASDGEAEAELFRRLAPRIRLYGLRHLRDRTAADDLVQDVILTTFDSLREGKVRDPRVLGSFVLGTCRKVLANLRRGERRRRELLERHGRELVPEFSEPEPLLDLDRRPLSRRPVPPTHGRRIVVLRRAQRGRDRHRAGAHARQRPRRPHALASCGRAWRAARAPIGHRPGAHRLLARPQRR